MERLEVRLEVHRGRADPDQLGRHSRGYVAALGEGMDQDPSDPYADILWRSISLVGRGERWDTMLADLECEFTSSGIDDVRQASLALLSEDLYT